MRLMVLVFSRLSLCFFLIIVQAVARWMPSAVAQASKVVYPAASRAPTMCLMLVGVCSASERTEFPRSKIGRSRDARLGSGACRSVDLHLLLGILWSFHRPKFATHDRYAGICFQRGTVSDVTNVNWECDSRHKKEDLRRV